ncbi:MAG: metallophosphoesterase, partial [Candidatus Kariarchaeaceae archaeon]
MGYAETLASATQVLAKGNNVRKVSGSALIAGDIHGDIDSLEKIIALREALDMKHLILLGDYVDRGEKQVEVVERIAELIKSDDDFVPLRGNHEDA